jgi:hypothetical protein
MSMLFVTFGTILSINSYGNALLKLGIYLLGVSMFS